MLGKRLKLRTVSLKPSLWNYYISLLNRFEVLRVHKVARKCVDCSAQRDAASKITSCGGTGSISTKKYVTWFWVPLEIEFNDTITHRQR